MKKVNLFFVLVLLVLFATVGCDEPSGRSGRIIYRDSEGLGYHSSAELPRVYVKPGELFIPGPDLKYYIMTNDQPLDYRSANIQPDTVCYTNPGEENLISGPQRMVLMPHQYFSSPSQQQVFVPAPQQPVVVRPPEQSRYQSIGPREVTCPTCGGTGKITCTACRGRGLVPCKPCRGTGYIIDDSGKRVTCTWCMGKGERFCSACSGTWSINGWIKCTRCDGRGVITVNK